MSYKIWLDDVRPAPDDSWMICRTVEHVQMAMAKYGWPIHISFDHDLGLDLSSGYDLANWLVERDLDHHDMPTGFTFAVHSMNPVGAENIGRLLTNYLAHRFPNTHDKGPRSIG